MPFPIAVNFGATGNLSAPGSAGGQLGTTSLYDKLGSTWSVASSFLSVANQNWTQNPLWNLGGSNPTARDQVVYARILFQGNVWYLLATRALSDLSGYYEFQLNGGTVGFVGRSTAVNLETPTVTGGAPSLTAGTYYWLVFQSVGVSPTALTAKIFADGAQPNVAIDTALYTYTASGSLSSLNNSASTYYQGVFGGVNASGNTYISKLTLDQYTQATLTAGDTLTTSSGGDIAISTTTTGGAGTNAYRLFGCSTSAGNYSSFTNNGSVTYQIGTSSSSPSFTHTPGTDEVWSYYISTTDSASTSVYTYPELAARQGPVFSIGTTSGIINAGIGDSIMLGSGASAASGSAAGTIFTLAQAASYTDFISRVAIYLNKSINQNVTTYNNGYSGTCTRHWLKNVLSTSGVALTTVAASIATGSQTVTPASMSSITSGTKLVIDTGASAELVTVASVTSTTFTATFAKSHNAGASIFSSYNFAGQTSGMLYNQAAAAWNSAGSPHIIIMALGTNDPVFNVSSSEYTTNVQAIIAAITADFPNAKIGLRAVPPKRLAGYASTYLAYNTALAGLADNSRTFFLAYDLFEQSATNSDTWWTYSSSANTGDPIHPADAGHDGIGRLIARDIYSKILNPSSSGTSSYSSGRYGALGIL